MTEIIDYLKEKYQPLSVIVYGSYADGTNNAHSDFDALVITDCEEISHDTSVQNGVLLDVFIYPQNAFREEYDCEEFVQISGGRIVTDTDGLAAKIMKNVDDYLAAKPQKSKEEIAEELVWCRKMLSRAGRQDAEGMYRLHLLLIESLEIFCDAMHTAYLGPKKSLKWMEQHYPEAYRCYEKALSECGVASGEQWIDWIEKNSGC